MLTTFDRYLIKCYLSAFAILFVSTFGLFVVIDGFTNVDAFQQGKEGTAEVLRWMAAYYGIQSIEFFDLVAPVLSVVAMMVVLALLQKNSELHPILAAGVPVYRLVLPILAGAMVVSSVVVLNQEFVIPRLGHKLQSHRTEQQTERSVEPLYDFKTRIHIDGKRLNLDENRLSEAEFILPANLATELTALKAPRATYLEKSGERPRGWLLRNVQPSYDRVLLTEEGKKLVRRTNTPGDVFIITDVSIDQLSNRSKNFRFLSTRQLVQRIRNPSTGLNSIRSQTLFFHRRLVRPLLNVLAAFIVLPLVLRKESHSLVGNIALCALVMSTMYGAGYLFSYLGQVNFMPADLAAWSPAFISGGVGAWLSGVVQS
ncbi:MAG: LptF/LptG family permease [Planctomycetaceae bacterium]